MPIRPAPGSGPGQVLRRLYPVDWPQISRQVRFERAGGRCQSCGRPHGETIRCPPDGRWYDAAARTWRNGRGWPARWPDLEEATRIRYTRVVLAAAHLDHNPANNRPHHLARRRITYLLRRALGDLFLGPYSRSEPRTSSIGGPALPGPPLTAAIASQKRGRETR